MPSLHEVQQAVAAAVLGGERDAAAAFVVDTGPGAAGRLGIYRNHYRITLVNALADTFPVVRRLVGDSFFRSLAGRFVDRMPPTGPCLIDYGGRVPGFLAADAAACGLPYLADVARLEWAIHAAAHAEDRPPVDHDALTTAATAAGDVDVMVRLAPGCRLVASSYPIDRIWMAHQVSEGDDIPIVDLAAGGAHLFVCRRDHDVGWLPLSPAAFVAAGVLVTDGSLGKAHALARAVDPAFELGSLLAALVAGDLVVDVVVPATFAGGANG